jgi:cytochrome b6-f complex iron-sulfur subunit
MSEENLDLSQFDDIPDRVERAKAKAEAVKKAREAAAGEGETSPEPETTQESASKKEPEDAGSGEATEVEVDLSSLDEIPDRVARARAKAEAMRKAKGAGGAAAPAKKAPAKKAVASTADRAAAARALTGKESAVAEREVIVQTSPAPPAIRPGPDRISPVTDGGITTRRGFFTWLTLAWVSFSGACLVGLAGFGRFLFPNVLFEPPQSFKIGFPEDYELGVDERWKDKFSIWIIRNTEGIFALISVCTHLGCTPNWLSNEQKFKCPCHGSGFYSTGINFEGPAPRPLERARIVLSDDGQILIDKNVKFQFEKGQWENPESFLQV